MKETTGEVSMTVVVLLGVALVAGIIAILKPNIESFIESKWTETTDSDWIKPESAE